MTRNILFNIFSALSGTPAGVPPFYHTFPVVNSADGIDRRLMSGTPPGFTHPEAVTALFPKAAREFSHPGGMKEISRGSTLSAELTPGNDAEVNAPRRGARKP